jgi:hypothetical protein
MQDLGGGGDLERLLVQLMRVLAPAAAGDARTQRIGV